MADLRVAPRYRGVEGLACPRCARRGEWRHLSLMLDRRVDHREPEGFVYVVRDVKAKGPKRLFRDDVKVPVDGSGDFPDDGGGFAWEHRYGLICTRCNAAYNREQAAYHAFEDSELPLDYWADHDENLALMRARGVTPEMVAAHERVLKAIGVTRPQGGDAR